MDTKIYTLTGMVRHMSVNAMLCLCDSVFKTFFSQKSLNDRDT